MKYLLAICIALSLTACAIEENNRKKFAERADNIARIQTELAENQDTKIKAFESYSEYTLTTKSEKNLYFFTKPNHPAHPSMIRKLFNRNTFRTWWDWNSAAQQSEINEFFYNILIKENKLKPLKCTIPRIRPCAAINQYPDGSGLYSNELMHAYYEKYSDCSCQVEVNNSKRRI